MSERQSFAGDAKQVVRGFLMGGADIIPGVSGGTVALILGIYERLVTALSRFDTTFLGHLKALRIRDALAHIDFRFLAALGTGIVIGIGSLASLMHHLMTDPQLRPLTLAGFFGLILASGYLVGRRVRQWTAGAVVLAIAGTLFAYWLTGLQSATVEPTYPYVFFSGAIAICAMILPGISGAYILLLLGMYLYVTGLIKGLPKGEISVEALVTVAIFCAGCGIGLLSFSKLLRWLLARHGSLTMALLGGFMIGSLRKIWPFKQDLTPDEHELKLKEFANVLPDSLDGPTLLTLGIMVLAAVAVLLLDRVAGPRR